jgi:hypothetical protein
MEFNISLLKCKQLSSALTITTTLYSVIELKLNVNMKFFKDNMKARKRKLMSNLNEYSKLKMS